jgi:hypothetical protein
MLVLDGADGLDPHLEEAGGSGRSMEVMAYPPSVHQSSLVGLSRQRVRETRLPVKTESGLRSRRAMVASTYRNLVEHVCILILLKASTYRYLVEDIYVSILKQKSCSYSSSFRFMKIIFTLL